MKNVIMQTIDQALDKLERSKFRSGFHLTKKEQVYLEDKGMDVMRKHAEDFVRQKLATADPVKDGKQTPIAWPSGFQSNARNSLLLPGLLKQVVQSPTSIVNSPNPSSNG